MTPQPTEAELEILQVLWAHGPSTVRFVNEALNQKREVGYTTTLKMMQIMSDKGLLSRNTDMRTHVYQAAIGEKSTQQKMLQNFLDTAFRGSAAQLVMQALGQHDASHEELDAIKALIKKLEQQRND